MTMLVKKLANVIAQMWWVGWGRGTQKNNLSNVKSIIHRFYVILHIHTPSRRHAVLRKSARAHPGPAILLPLLLMILYPHARIGTVIINPYPAKAKSR